MKKMLLLALLLTMIGTAYAQYTVGTVAGDQPRRDYIDGNGLTTAAFDNLRGVAIDVDGNLIVCDRNNHLIRKVNLTTGMVSTVAGATKAANPNAVPPTAKVKAPGHLDNSDPLLAQFDNVSGVAIDAVGNMYLADMNNFRIRKIAAGTHAVTTIAGKATAGLADGAGAGAEFKSPIAITIDAIGNLYIADGNRIRKIAAATIANGTYVVETIAGDDATDNVDGTGGTSGTARFNTPSGVAIDNDGHILVADLTNNLVRKINKDTYAVTTIAGFRGTGNNVNPTALNEGSDALTVPFRTPYGIAVNKINGDIYVTQNSSHIIRRISAGKAYTIGDVTAIGSGNIDGNGTVAKFFAPQALVVHQGVLYVGDGNNYKIRKVTGGGALPVNLTSFTAQKQNNAIKLNWVTASEKNNSHFDILRSADGNNASVIGTVAGSGNSSDIKTYSYVDHAPLSGDNYYQLRQVDFDGVSELSGIVAVGTDLQEAALKVYATSDNPEITLTVYSPKGGKAALRINNVQGANIVAQDIVLVKGYSILKLSASLQKGVYVASLNTGAESVVTKFVAQ